MVVQGRLETGLVSDVAISVIPFALQSQQQEAIAVQAYMLRVLPGL